MKTLILPAETKPTAAKASRRPRKIRVAVCMPDSSYQREVGGFLKKAPMHVSFAATNPRALEFIPMRNADFLIVGISGCDVPDILDWTIACRKEVEAAKTIAVVSSKKRLTNIDIDKLLGIGVNILVGTNVNPELLVRALPNFQDSYLDDDLAIPDEELAAALSMREWEILAKYGLSHTAGEIAAIFDLSPRTVAAHRKSIARKLRVSGKDSSNVTSALTRWYILNQKLQPVPQKKQK